MDGASAYIPVFIALNCVLFIFFKPGEVGEREASAVRESVSPHQTKHIRTGGSALTNMSLLHTAQRKNHVFVCPVALIKHLKSLHLNDRTLGYLE